MELPVKRRNSPCHALLSQNNPFVLTKFSLLFRQKNNTCLYRYQVEFERQPRSTKYPTRYALQCDDCSSRPTITILRTFGGGNPLLHVLHYSGSLAYAYITRNKIIVFFGFFHSRLCSPLSFRSQATCPRFRSLRE